MMAVELGYVQWIELLMEHRTNINQKKHISHSNVMRTLIANNAKTNVKSCVFQTGRMTTSLRVTSGVECFAHVIDIEHNGVCNWR